MTPPYSTAVVVHSYHLHRWPTIASKLSATGVSSNLIISTVPELEAVSRKIVTQRFPHADIRVFPNYGMDVLPFVRLLPEIMKNEYTAVCKIHGKNDDTVRNSVWGNTLLETLVGDTDLVHAVLDAFERFGDLNLVGPAALFQSAHTMMSSNWSALERLQDILSLDCQIEVDWGFFPGTMFWVRPSALRPLANATVINQLAQWGYRESAPAQDGNLAHALERLICGLPEVRSGRVGLIHPLLTESRNGERTNRFGLQITDSSDFVAGPTIGQVVDQIQRADLDAHWIRESRLLDEPEYRKQCSTRLPVATDLAKHYLTVGRFKGFKLNPSMDITGYEKRYGAMVRTSNALSHYVTVGARTGLRMESTERRKPLRTVEETSFRNRALNASVVDWECARLKRRDTQLISIIMPVTNHAFLTRRAVRAVMEASRGHKIELVIVDNCSHRWLARRLWRLQQRNERIRFVRSARRVSQGVASNMGFGASRGSTIVLLESTTEVTKAWLDPLVKALRDTSVSVVQPLVLSSDGRVYSMGIVFQDGSVIGQVLYHGIQLGKKDLANNRRLQAVSGPCVALRAHDYGAVLGLDPTYVNGQEYVDLCLRLNNRTGRECMVTPDSVVIEQGKVHPGRRHVAQFNREIFRRRFENQVVCDAEEHYARDGFSVRTYVPVDPFRLRESLVKWKPILDETETAK